MNITYICHSSFAVELEKSILIFDYYGEGDLPVLPPGKQLYFLNSHNHQDHFNREILTLREQYQEAVYILSRDIRICREEQREWIHSVKPREDYEIGTLRIHTLRSTDQGVAFAVETEGKRIYHAGDLNWWHWEGEDKAWNRNMEVNYKREVDSLAGQSFDAAFVPLDPRLKSAYYWGMKYFLENVKAEHVFPMHCWEDYEVCRKATGESRMKGLLNSYHAVEQRGQEWRNLC